MNPFLLAAISSASLGLAHTVFVQLEIGGITHPVGEGVRIATNDGAPITDLTSDDLACNGGPNPLQPTDRLMDVKAGSDIFAIWRANKDAEASDIMDTSHLGPTTVMMKRVADAKTDTGVGDGWFKIQHEGYNNGQWATSNVIKNAGRMPIRIPACLEDGQYLLRAEMIALHAASQPQGAQFHMECAQINLKGGKPFGTPPVTSSIPGIYKADDPGLLITIYSMKANSDYKIPGPEPFSCPVTLGLNPAVDVSTAPSLATKLGTHRSGRGGASDGPSHAPPVSSEPPPSRGANAGNPPAAGPPSTSNGPRPGPAELPSASAPSTPSNEKPDASNDPRTPPTPTPSASRNNGTSPPPASVNPGDGPGTGRRDGPRPTLGAGSGKAQTSPSPDPLAGNDTQSATPDSCGGDGTQSQSEENDEKFNDEKSAEKAAPNKTSNDENSDDEDSCDTESDDAKPDDKITENSGDTKSDDEESCDIESDDAKSDEKNTDEEAEATSGRGGGGGGGKTPTSPSPDKSAENNTPTNPGPGAKGEGGRCNAASSNSTSPAPSPGSGSPRSSPAPSPGGGVGRNGGRPSSTRPASSAGNGGTRSGPAPSSGNRPPQDGRAAAPSLKGAGGNGRSSPSIDDTNTTSTSTPPNTSGKNEAGSTSACPAARYGQCGGGPGYAGCTSCASGSACQKMNDFYSQCL